MMNIRKKLMQRRLKDFSVTGIKGEPTQLARLPKRYASTEEKELHGLVNFVKNRIHTHVDPEEWRRVSDSRDLHVFERRLFMTLNEEAKIDSVLKRNDLSTKEKLKRVKEIIKEAPEEEEKEV